MTYAERNKDYITASKLLCYRQDWEEDYVNKYILLLKNKKDTTSSMELGTLFHKIMEIGIDSFNEQYEILGDRQRTSSYKGYKIPITRSMGTKCMWAYQSVCNKPLIDLQWIYRKEQEIIETYNDAEIKVQIDRYTEGNHPDYKIPLIRDYKFTSGIEVYKSEYLPKAIYQMAVYSFVLNIHTWLEYAAIIDMISHIWQYEQYRVSFKTLSTYFEQIEEDILSLNELHKKYANANIEWDGNSQPTEYS